MKQRRAITKFGFVLLVLLGISIVFFLNFHTVVVSGPSMLPTLQDKQRVLVSQAYWLHGPVRVGDVVVVKGLGETDFVIKRVYKLGGQVVEPELQPKSVPLGVPFVVPMGTAYVLGDNRESSEDSRAFGPVPLDSIIGKVVRW